MLIQVVYFCFLWSMSLQGLFLLILLEIRFATATATATPMCFMVIVYAKENDKYSWQPIHQKLYWQHNEYRDVL